MKKIIASLAVTGTCMLTACGAETNVPPCTRASAAGYPKLFMFRNCEAFMESNSTREFESCVKNRIVGFIGKVFNEEVENRTPDDLALVNPARAPYTFDLDNLYPGKKFRRLPGGGVNTGEAVAGSVILGARDGLFLISDPSITS